MLANKIVDLGITFAVWSTIMVAIHAFSHHIATWLQGGRATITWFGIWADQTHIQGLSPSETQIVYFAGGLITAALMGALWWRAIKSPGWNDLDDEGVLGMIAAAQLGYGLAEGLTLGTAGFVVAGPLITAIFMLPVLVYYSLKWAKWLGRPGYD